MGRMWFLWSLCGALSLAGCHGFEGSPNPSPAGGGTGGTPTTPATGGGNLFDAETDTAPPCCVNSAMFPLQGPSWFQIGEPGSLGPCPNPTTEGVTGYAEMKVAPHTCAACSCSPAVCTLPGGIHTNAAKCPGDGSIAVPFGPDPAAGWEGLCSEEGALPANLQCNGVPCVQSLSIPPLPIPPCPPTSGPAEPLPEPTWGRMARQCQIEPLSGEGCDANQVCAPTPPEGFVLCLHVQAEHPTCPPEYPAHMVFHSDVNDERGCELCQCSAPEGAQCAAIVSAFADPACSSLVVAVLVSTGEPTCTDVISGIALGSAEATMVTDVPGSCSPSGGAPVGALHPTAPLTLCCQGTPNPPG